MASGKQHMMDRCGRGGSGVARVLRAFGPTDKFVRNLDRRGHRRDWGPRAGFIGTGCTPEPSSLLSQLRCRRLACRCQRSFVAKPGH